jgi:hypothetical protein
MSEPVIFNLYRPSDALEAMCDGLEDIDARADFSIHMSTFGKFEGGLCFVCAATCAAIKAADLLPEGVEELKPGKIEETARRA